MVPGTSHFSDQIAYAISKTGTMAAVTDTVHKALKKVGMDVDEFMSLKNMSALDDKIEEMRKSLRKNKGKKNRKALEEFQEAIEKLKKWFIKMKSDNKFAMGSAEGGVGNGAQSSNAATPPRPRRQTPQADGLAPPLKAPLYQGLCQGLYQRYDGVPSRSQRSWPSCWAREIPTGPKMEDLMDAFQTSGHPQPALQRHGPRTARHREQRRGPRDQESFLSSLKLIVRKVDDVLSSKDYGGSSSLLQRAQGRH